MTTTLTNLGEELALIIDRQVLESLGIDAETRLEVSVDERGIHIRPAPDDHQTRVVASARRMMDLHDETFRKLAR
jgi:antitoxin component of MazEF toxin-antitoxin module